MESPPDNTSAPDDAPRAGGAPPGRKPPGGVPAPSGGVPQDDDEVVVVGSDATAKEPFVREVDKVEGHARRVQGGRRQRRAGRRCLIQRGTRRLGRRSTHGLSTQ